MIIDYEKIRGILWAFVSRYIPDGTFTLIPAPTDKEIDALVADMLCAMGPEEKEIDLSPDAIRVSLDMIALNHIIRTLSSTDTGGMIFTSEDRECLLDMEKILRKRLSLEPWEKEEAVAGSDQ